METTIPVFPCRLLEETLDFYQALGFTVTHEQTSPYVYGAVQRGEVALHFTRLKGGAGKLGTGMCLVMVQQIGAYHKDFADGLRARYGAVPTAGAPRITRLRLGQTRFHVFDPAGNILLFIDQSEPEIDYDAYDETISPLAHSLENAAFLRDTYTNDEAAARVLDKALARHADAAPIDRARALAARAELAVALGDMTRAAEMLATLKDIALTAEERERYAEELNAAEELVRWIEDRR